MSIPTKKINKRQAYDLVIKLRDGEELSNRQKEELVFHFAPALPKKVQDAFSWVAQAVSPSDVRVYLRAVLVEDGKMYATNGSRLHVAKSDGRNPGFYDAKTGARIPDESMAGHRFPREACDRLIQVPSGAAKVLIQDFKRVSVDVNTVALKCDGGAFNEKWVQQGGAVEELQIKGNNLYGQSPFGRFVIMCIRGV